METSRKSFPVRTFAAQHTMENIRGLPVIKFRPAPRLVYVNWTVINILFQCFTFDLQYFRNNEVVRSWDSPGVDCEDRIPVHWLVLAPICLRSDVALQEPLLLWPSAVCELFVYLFQIFSGSCARYLLLYYYKPQQIKSRIVPEWSRKIWKGQSTWSPVHPWPHARDASVTQIGREFDGIANHDTVCHWM